MAAPSDTITLRAFAKVNLTLEVIARRADGYHELRSLVQCISLADELTLRRIPAGIRLHSSGCWAPEGAGNLCVQAAQAFIDFAGNPPGVDIALTKRIPAGRGLGGGSSDAAAVLRGLAGGELGLVLAAFEFVAAEQRDGVSITLSGSTRERLYIIDFVYDKIIQHPLIGWGFDASRAIGQDTQGLSSSNPSIPLHPHNLWAQTWLELGLVGLVLMISLVVSISMRLAAGGRGRATVAAAAATVATYLLIGNISYGMWQNWWLVIAWLNAGFLAVMAVADGGAEP